MKPAEVASSIEHLSFLQFCALCQIQLTPGQETIARVLFDYQDPCDLPERLRPLAREIFGDVDRVPSLARAVATVVAGGRGGKSYLFSIRLLHLCYTVPLHTLAPGEEAFAIVVAPDKKLAKQSLNYALGALKTGGLAATLADQPVAESFTIARGNRRVVYSIFAASAGGSSVRGRSLVGAALDEAAFFGDDSYAVNDLDLYRAASPRVMVGGQFMIGSTPWSEDGLIYDLWRNNWGNPQTTCVAHAPTRVMRNSGSAADRRVLDEVAREEIRDPANARREFGALFLAAGSDLYFSSTAIEAALVPQAKTLSRGDLISVGGDLGFTTDASTEVVLATDKSGTIWLIDALELLPDEGKPLVPSQVGRAFKQLASKYGADCVVADAVYREALREWLGSIAVVSAPAGNEGKVLSYDKLKRALLEGRFRVASSMPPALIERLRVQLKQVRSKPQPGGGMSISSPRRRGHGDIVSALVCAISRAPWIEAPVEEEKTPDEIDDEILRAHNIGPFANCRDWWQSGDTSPDWAMQ